MRLYLNREEVMQAIGSRLFRLAVLGGLLLFILGFVSSPALALTLSSGRDCDANAVMHCGALTTNELGQKYKGQGLIALYSRFDISSQDINNINNTAVEGLVTNNNNVWVHRSSGLCSEIDPGSLSSQNQQAVRNNPNLCLVATNAMTAGRQNMSGSTAITAGGVTFYMRPPSVSFASSPLTAFVVMKDSKFAFAIIASCGNPVMATPVVPAKKPAPAPPVTQPSPPQVISATTPPPAPAASAPRPTQIGKFGPGNTIEIGAVATVLGTAGHYFYQRRRLL